MKQNPPFIPVLAALIKNNKGEFLIARRKPMLNNGGKWEFPGGKLQLGEVPEDCLTREIKEELGIEIKVEGSFRIVNQSYSKRSILLISYFCEYVSGDINLKDHDQIEWVRSDLLMQYDLSEPDKPIAAKLNDFHRD
jgi:8-oxo-dGTP diphosphatase